MNREGAFQIIMAETVLDNIMEYTGRDTFERLLIWLTRSSRC